MCTWNVTDACLQDRVDSSTLIWSTHHLGVETLAKRRDMVSRRLSSSSSSALASGGLRKDSQQLDVVFNTDPMFVHAGNGTAVPRGLSGVQHDQSAAPVLNFRSDDAFAVRCFPLCGSLV